MTNPVRQSFNRAAGSYAASAALQQLVRDQLLRQATQGLTADYAGTLLDAGCGTGELLQQLRADLPCATIIGVDFAEDMLRQQLMTPGLSRVNADLQQLPIADSHVDLYLSSLAWQWCDVHHVLNEAHRVLKPGGSLWLTTLVDGTFHEMAAAFSAAELSPAAHLLTMSQESTVLNTFRETGAPLVAARCQPITTWHADFNALRHSIRGVGANRLPSAARELLDRAARNRLIEAYEALRTPRGLPLTYNVLTIHALRSA